jgi:hypothetical protein
MAAAGRGRGRGRGLLARELPEDAQTRPGSIASEDAKVVFIVMLILKVFSCLK